MPILNVALTSGDVYYRGDRLDISDRDKNMVTVSVTEISIDCNNTLVITFSNNYRRCFPMHMVRSWLVCD